VVNPDALKYDGFENFTWTASMGGAYAQDAGESNEADELRSALEVQGAMYDVKE
jgi:hypothetical protein